MLFAQSQVSVPALFALVCSNTWSVLIMLATTMRHTPPVQIHPKTNVMLVYLAVTSRAFLQVGNDQFYEVLEKVSGQKGIDDWAKLQKLMEPLAKAATAVPPIAIRADPGVALTAIARYLPRLFSGGPDALKLIGPFSKVTPCSELLHSLLLQLICIAIH